MKVCASVKTVNKRSGATDSALVHRIRILFCSGVERGKKKISLMFGK